MGSRRLSSGRPIVWWLLKVIVFVVLLVLLVFVAVSNDGVVDVHLLGWHFTEVRVFLIMLISAMVGLSCGLAFAAVRELQWRLHIGKQEREKGDLKREVHHLRKSPLTGLDETSPVGDPPRKSD